MKGYVQKHLHCDLSHKDTSVVCWGCVSVEEKNLHEKKDQTAGHVLNVHALNEVLLLVSIYICICICCLKGYVYKDISSPKTGIKCKSS